MGATQLQGDSPAAKGLALVGIKSKSGNAVNEETQTQAQTQTQTHTHTHTHTHTQR
jgi:hypothetical protein